MLCNACPDNTAQPHLHCTKCHQHIRLTLSGKWAGVRNLTICPDGGQHEPGGEEA